MSTNRTNDFESPIPISQGGTGATTAAQARIDLGITIGARTIEGTADQIQVVNGNGAGGNPVISIKSNPIIPGSESMTVPVGTNVTYPVTPALGMIRANTDTDEIEFYANAQWNNVGSGTVTNLTGPITSVGNATSIASQTGIGSKFVVDDTPTLITPILGVATATSVNKVTLTAPATSATLTIADGKTLTQSNILTYSGTDGSSVDFGTGGTVVYNAFSSVVTQVFTSSGTYTPTVGMKYCVAEVIGAGGGGGGVAGVLGQTACAAGGGAGGYSRSTFTAGTIGVSQSVTIGLGGSGGVAGNNPGITGGTTSLGAIISSTGGAGGTGGASSIITNFSGAAGPGGIGTGAAFNSAGGSGGRGHKITTTVAFGGQGGNSVYGAGGTSLNGPAAGAIGRDYGSGGSGAAGVGATSFAGGNGSSGLIIITEYI